MSKFHYGTKKRCIEGRFVANDVQKSFVTTSKRETVWHKTVYDPNICHWTVYGSYKFGTKGALSTIWYKMCNTLKGKFRKVLGGNCALKVPKISFLFYLFYILCICDPSNFNLSLLNSQNFTSILIFFKVYPN